MFTETDAVEMFRRPPDRMIEVDGFGVAHRVVGSGPPVLFVHGWPVSGATFRRLLPHLVDHVTCHLIDLPGAGDSRWPDASRLSLAADIAVVRALPEALGLEGFGVVGHDSGGLIARHALVDHPGLRAMGLIDTEHPRPSAMFRAFVSARHLPGIPSALGLVASRPAVARNRFVFGGAFVDRARLGGEFDEFFLRPLREDPARRGAAAQLLRSFDPGLVAALADLHPRLRVPVGLVWGARDPFFPVARAREMAGQFPDARLTVVDDAALFAHEERPVEVAAALLEVLRTLS